jgi:trimeric autotransporter adhesin
MQGCAVKTGVVLLLASFVVGCGGGSRKTTNVVAQVTLSPSSVSIVAGQVTQISAGASNSSGNAVSPLPTFTFNSSNTKIATVSPSGLVCGGVWDSFFIVCNGADSSGNPIAGTAVITASAQGVSSAPIQVSVHPSVTSITVDPVAGCISIKGTQQFVAHAFHNATDITSLVGNFTWTLSIPSVGSIDANGLVTATAPGLTGVIANVGTTSSPAVNFRSCMPVQITLHVNGDPAGQPTESVTLNVNDTKTIEADMVDELGVTTNSAPVTIVSNNTEVASVAGVTLTGQSPGGAGLVAACAPPACGAGINNPVYSNLFQVTVNGSSPATTVYATTSFAPPSGTTPTLIPIDTSKSPIVAGTAINLPGTPNSMIFAPGGGKAYLGTSAGIASLDTTANTVTLLDPFVGKALAVSPDGNTVIFSNAAMDPGTGTPIEPVGPSQRLVILRVTNNSVQSFVLQGAVAAAFTSDGFKAFIAADCSHNTPPATCPDGNAGPNGNVIVFSPSLTLQVLNIGGATGNNASVATLASGPFAFFANSAGLEAMATCNNTPQAANNPPISPPTQTTAITLLGATQNANMIVAVDSPGIDIETATVGPLATAFPFTFSAATCAPPVTYNNQFIDFGQGAITARQLLVPTNSAGHIVVLPVGINQLLVAVPGTTPSVQTITLAGGATEALSGGMTLDGNTAWVGVAGTNSVDRIDLSASSDNLQIATSFKKSDGTTPAPPNIVAVKPK